MTKAKSNLKQSNAKGKISPNYLNLKFDIYNIRSIPDVGEYYHHEFRQRVDEINQHSGSLLNNAAQVFNKLLPGINASNKLSQLIERKNAKEIAVFQPSQKNLKHSDKLDKDPQHHAVRVALGLNVIKAGGSLEIEQVRKILMQLAIPIGMEHFDASNIKILISAYRIYKTKLIQSYKKERERLEKLSHGGNTKYDQLLRYINKNEELLLKLLDRPIDRVQLADYIKSVQKETIHKSIDGTLKIPKGSTLSEIRESIERNLATILMYLIEVDFLHHELLRIAETLMKPLNPSSPLAAFVEACIWENQLKSAVLMDDYAVTKSKDLVSLKVDFIQEELTKKNMEERMKDCLKKCLSAYGQSIKYIQMISNMRDVQQKILIKHARICLYSYSLRDQLKIPESVYCRFLISGKKSIQLSTLNEENDKFGLIEKYQKILETHKIPGFLQPPPPPPSS